jgi:hypothetical protein
MTVEDLAKIVAQATKVPRADLEKSFANIIKRQESLEFDKLGNVSKTVEALRGGLTKLDREKRRKVISAVAALAIENPKASVLVETFTTNDTKALELNRDAALALVLFDAGLDPLDWLEKGDKGALEKLRPRAIARREALGSAWKLELDMLGVGTGEAELRLAERMFALLALPCSTDAEAIQLALDGTGPGSQGYELLLACAGYLRTKHGVKAPRELDSRKVWDGGGREKAQGVYEILSLAVKLAPELVPDLAVKLFAQMWAPKRTPGLWLAFAESLEDHKPKGEGRYLSATARIGDVQLKYSRSKVKIEPPKRITGKRSSR